MNSLPSGRRSPIANGIETYFLSEAKTEDQRRVARMENDAIRYESPDAQVVEGALATIVKDLQQNEYLRESARLAELVQQRVASVHPGEDRGVQQAGFYVLNSARRPAILVETGFATNKKDGAFLASAAGQRTARGVRPRSGRLCRRPRAWRSKPRTSRRGRSRSRHRHR